MLLAAPFYSVVAKTPKVEIMSWPAIYRAPSHRLSFRGEQFLTSKSNDISYHHVSSIPSLILELYHNHNERNSMSYNLLSSKITLELRGWLKLGVGGSSDWSISGGKWLSHWSTWEVGCLYRWNWSMVASRAVCSLSTSIINDLLSLVAVFTGICLDGLGSLVGVLGSHITNLRGLIVDDLSSVVDVCINEFLVVDINQWC